MSLAGAACPYRRRDAGYMSLPGGAHVCVERRTHLLRHQKDSYWEQPAATVQRSFNSNHSGPPLKDTLAAGCLSNKDIFVST